MSNCLITSASHTVATLSGGGFGNIVSSSEERTAYILSQPEYDNGTLGSVVSGYSQTVYSDDRAATGSKSAKATINSGSAGSSEFGLNYAWTNDLTKGDEVWVKGKFYFPSGFDFTTDFSLKTIRTHILTSSLSNRGYDDLYINNNRTLLHQNEIVPGQDNELFSDQGTNPSLNNSYTVPFDEWVDVETYTKLDETDGIFRVWVNGVLLYEQVGWRTLGAASDLCRNVLIFTYWNGLSPATQSCYIDDITIAGTVDQGLGSVVLDTDSLGNHHIEYVETDELLFEDDFSSGDLNKTQNGFTWEGGTGTTVSTLNPRTGTHSLRFDFQYLQLSEQRFALGALYPELTQEYYLYIPDGTESWGGLIYDHYNSDGGSRNNKFQRLWDTKTESGNPEKVGSSLGLSADTGISKIYGEWNNGEGMNWQGTDTEYQNFINTSDRGSWIKVKTYHKSATSANNDGIAKLYKNDVLVYSRTTVDNYTASGDHAWANGYLLGSQAGVLPQPGDHLYMFIDEYKAYTGEV